VTSEDITQLVKVTVVKYFDPSKYYSELEYKEAGVTTPQAAAAFEAHMYREGVTHIDDILQYEDNDVEVEFAVVLVGHSNEGAVIREEEVYVVPSETY
jgi:hypothetical protein